MKKACFSLLTALLLLPLLCFSAQAADTSSVTVQAFRPSEDKLIVVDGSADEIFWLLDTPVGTSRLGALCDGHYIYLAFHTSETTASFTINGKAIFCSLGAKPTTDLGTIAGQDNVYELRLTYSQLGVNLYTTKNDTTGTSDLTFSATIGEDTASGTLVLNAGGLKLTGEGKDLTGADYYASLSGASTGSITVTEGGVFTIKNDGAKEYYSCTTSSNTDWSNLSLPGMVMAFEADFNDLPASSTRSYMYHFGLFWVVSDGDDRYDMAFWADDSGQIRFTVHQATIADARTKALPTGIYLGSDAAQNVRVRILMDSDHNVTLYLNGVKIGTLLADPNPPSGSSSVSGRLQFYADHRNRNSKEHSVNVTLSDFSFKELTAVEPRPLLSYDLTFYTNDDNPVDTERNSTSLKKVPGYVVNRLVSFDTTHNSIVLDQKSSQRFNRIHLFDQDEFSRVSQNDLGVFVSTDGKSGSWTKVTGWQLHQEGRRYTIYNLDETARFVKVHTYLDDLNQKDDYVSFDSSFSNYVDQLMTVEYSEYMLGADSDFAYTGSLTVSNPNETDLYDEPVQIALSEIGAFPGEYLDSCADFRFTLGSQLLPHWYDGDGSFYVRIPYIPADGSAAITPHWGNPDAQDISDRQATFEAVYGNVSLVNLSKNYKTNLIGSGRAFTFPDGSIIVVARDRDTDGEGTADSSELTAVFSYDGGRTFTKEGVDLIDDAHSANRAGFGSFIWDPDIGEKGRLYLMAYMVYEAVPKDALDTSYKVADCRFVYLYTEDYGKTWSDPVVLCDAAANMAKLNEGEEYTVIRNSQGRFYQLSYCDGLTLKDADGEDGSNVDYVLTHGFITEDNVFGVAAIYSTDGGKTWTASDGSLTVELSSSDIANIENGISETALAQLEDGRLYILARTQAPKSGARYFFESYSEDFGNTWSEAQPSKVIATNTHPVFLPYNEDRLLLWPGNSSRGSNTYRRAPMTLAISSDEYKTYDRSLNLTLGTAFDSLDYLIERMTQPSLSVSPDGNEAFVCWTNLAKKQTVGMLIEEFDEMIYHTKGAYDGFECTSIKGEGWLLGDLIRTSGAAEITDEIKPRSGERCMRLLDNDIHKDVNTTASDASYPAVVLRQVPSMRKGKVGISLYAPNSNTTDFVFELKPAYNYIPSAYTVAGFGIEPDGKLFRVEGVHGTDVTLKKTYVGDKKITLDEWHDFAIEFDMDTKKGTLWVDGEPVAEDFVLFGTYDCITVVELGEGATTSTSGSKLYADDFYAVELADKVTVELGESRLSVSEYKDSGTLPQQDNCVFAGWYSDVDRTRPYTESTGYAYPKFVHRDVLGIKVQVSAGTSADSTQTNLRLLTSVDSLNYSRVGFKITINGTEVPVSSKKVFTRIVAKDGDDACSYTPKVFSDQSRYFMTYIITKIPLASFSTPIKVVPYWITLDETEVEGESLTFTINDIIGAPLSGLVGMGSGSGDSESFENMFAPQT